MLRIAINEGNFKFNNLKIRNFRKENFVGFLWEEEKWKSENFCIGIESDRVRKLKKRKKKKWPLIFMELFMPPWIVGEKDKRSEVDKNTECVSKTQSYLCTLKCLSQTSKFEHQLQLFCFCIDNAPLLCIRACKRHPSISLLSVLYNFTFSISLVYIVTTHESLVTTPIFCHP